MSIIFSLLASIVISASQSPRLILSSPNWTLQSEAQIEGGGNQISSKRFDDSSWLRVGVPSTVLNAFVDAGEIPDPMLDGSVEGIPEAFFASPFWYRTEFALPRGFARERVFLRFEGLAGASEIWLNGHDLPLSGGRREEFEVTDIVRKANCLAVRIVPDSKTGSGLPGYGSGIVGNVYVVSAGDVTISNPFAVSRLSGDTLSAQLSLGAELCNHSHKTLTARVEGKFGSENPFSLSVRLSPMERREISAVINVDRPQLWWPNGYGAQKLYDVSLSVFCGRTQSDRIGFKAGIREVEKDSCGFMKVNGVTVPIEGMTWRCPDILGRCSPDRYDASVKTLTDAHLTALRNLSTYDEAFFEACDTYGLVVLQDPAVSLRTHPCIVSTVDMEPVSIGDSLLDYDSCRTLFESHPVILDNMVLGGPAYYAVMKALEPVHIQYNPQTSMLEVVNRSRMDYPLLSFSAEWVDFEGEEISLQTGAIASRSGSMIELIPLSPPKEPACLYLELANGDKTLALNCYTFGNQNNLPKASLLTSGGIEEDGRNWIISYTIENLGSVPALLLCAEVKDAPMAHWSDNYISLMPYEVRTLRAEVPFELCPEQPEVVLSGFNL